MRAGVIKLHVLAVVHSYKKTSCQRQLHSPTKLQLISLSINNCNESKNKVSTTSILNQVLHLIPVQRQYPILIIDGMYGCIDQFVRHKLLTIEFHLEGYQPI